MYGVQCFHLNKRSVQELEKTQSKLLKAALGLRYYCRKTELLCSMKIHKVSTSIKLLRIDMLKMCINNSSVCNGFYSQMVGEMLCGSDTNHHCLASRCHDVFNSEGISMFTYLYDDIYARKCKRNILKFPQSGIADTITFLLSSQTPDHRELVNLLLKPF